jgi:hypothetical protein
MVIAQRRDRPHRPRPRRDHRHPSESPACETIVDQEVSELVHGRALRADVDTELDGHVVTRSFRSALRLTLPASSRMGWSTHSKLRGTL